MVIHIAFSGRMGNERDAMEGNAFIPRRKLGTWARGNSHGFNRVVRGLVQITIPHSFLVQRYRVVIFVMIHYGMPCDRAQWKRMGVVLPCGAVEGGWTQQPGSTRTGLEWSCFGNSVTRLRFRVVGGPGSCALGSRDAGRYMGLFMGCAWREALVLKFT